jgi:hypothetical protein
MERDVIPDAPPAGYIPLSTAFERFCRRYQRKKLAGRVETKDEWRARLSNEDKVFHDFLHHLRTGRLRAIVCHPVSREKIPIPPEAWTTARYPERPLMARVITGQDGEAFLAYAGRTPFVLQAKLSAILNAGAQTEREQYPWVDCLAAFRNRVADDGAPTKDGGETGWRNQADVERWIIGWMLKTTGREPSEPTARRRAKEFMDSIG